MPTAPKLVAAILMAVLGYVTAELIIGHLPPEVRTNLFREISAFLGLLVGWRFLGRRAGAGFGTALGFGLSAAAALVLCGLVYFSGYEMIIRALRKSYDGPFEGLLGMMDIAIQNLDLLGYADVLGVLIVGGLIVGLLTEAAAKRWT